MNHHCHGTVAAMTATFIDMLFKIVRERGLVRNSSEKYQFLK
jgi:hypothetical protein